MSKVIDIIGQSFDRLTVIQRVENNRWGRACWLCLCYCGQKTTISSNDIIAEKTKSCGCYRVKHGHRRRSQQSKTYGSWDRMTQRCTNKNHESYPRYGGRGVRICRAWRKFENFLKDMGKRPTSKHTLDRIDNNAGYYKENCRWATKKEQARNRRDNRMISHGGRILCLAAWAEELGIENTTLWWRLNHGWSIERTLTTPARKKRKFKQQTSLLDV